MNDRISVSGAAFGWDACAPAERGRPAVASTLSDPSADLRSPRDAVG
ncbi:hypothetical protein [Agromyces sp. ZXT2-3]